LDPLDSASCVRGSDRDIRNSSLDRTSGFSRDVAMQHLSL